MRTANKPYGLSRGYLLRMVFSRATGFPVGYYLEAKRAEGVRRYWVQCGYLGCYWESGVHSLEMVCDDAWRHALEDHPEGVL